MERSVDGVNFISIGKVNAAGSSNQRNNYSFADNASPSSTVYYRVRLHDIDGSKTYSNTVSVMHSTTTGGFAVNPNPVSDRFNVTMQAPLSSVGQLQLVELSGKVVWSKQYNLQKGQSYLSISRTSEARGTYVMVFRVNGTVATQKVVIRD